MLARSRIAIDRRERAIVSEFCIVVPLKRRRSPLLPATGVWVTKEEVGGGTESADIRFPVRIGAGISGITLVRPRRYAKAREVAEKVARFLGVVMTDVSTGTAVVRDADSLNLSLREKGAWSWPASPLWASVLAEFRLLFPADARA